jgi:hypothetical protein
MSSSARLMVMMRREAGLSVVLAIQASIMFVVSPLAATGVIFPGALDVFRFALATTAVLMLTRDRFAAALIVATFLVSLSLSFVMQRGDREAAGYVLRVAVTTAFDLSIATTVARVAFGPGRVTFHRIMGGVILYLSIGLIFANFYRVAAVLLHPSFEGLPDDREAETSGLLYFSLSTLTTTGFGDIIPVHPLVRSLSNLEAVIGQLFPATLLARLVTQHAARRRDD